MSGVFDWHSARPVDSTAELTKKLNDFKFSTTDASMEGSSGDEGRAKEEEEEAEAEAENTRRARLEGPELLHELLRLTEGFSGAEVVSAVQEAGMLAIDEGEDTLLLSHLFSAVLAIKPQITQEVLSFYKKIAATY